MRQLLHVGGLLLTTLVGENARADLVIETDFEESPPWQFLLLGPVAGSGGIYPTGGNPGGNTNARFSVFEPMSLGGMGTFHTPVQFISDYVGGEVTISADYRFIDDQPQGMAPEIVPVIRQGLRGYYPAQRTQADTDESWHALTPLTFSLDSFINSTGIPLDYSQPVQIGIVGILVNDGAGTPRTHFALDNVRIEIVPAPGPGATAVAVLVFGTGRRRPRCAGRG